VPVDWVIASTLLVCFLVYPSACCSFQKEEQSMVVEICAESKNREKVEVIILVFVVVLVVIKQPLLVG